MQPAMPNPGTGQPVASLTVVTTSDQRSAVAWYHIGIPLRPGAGVHIH